jgi:cystathionine beta-lyase
MQVVLHISERFCHLPYCLPNLIALNARTACRVYFFQNAEGTGAAAHGCWLALRGLKTMALRMEERCQLPGHRASWTLTPPHCGSTTPTFPPAAALSALQVRPVV